VRSWRNGRRIGYLPALNDPSYLACAHAERLLAALNQSARVSITPLHPALAWCRAGLDLLTGESDGPPLVAPIPLAALADGALAALRVVAPEADLPSSGALLLGERARLMGLTRQGEVSANGTCRLLKAKGGRIAINIPRSDDLELLPALFKESGANLQTLARHVAERDRDALVAQGRLLGLAISADEDCPPPQDPFAIVPGGGQTAPCKAERPLVIDLSSLWAGPLAGSLLAAAGAVVVKVESPLRPDGARMGHAGFFDLLNAEKRCVALRLTDSQDLQMLHGLIARADIVIESSRPRALQQIGLDARRLAASGKTWLSITAYGRQGEAADWIGFGDDAAIAGGLGRAMERAFGRSMFAGDAIADPLAGITGALAALAVWRSGMGGLIDISLCGVIAHACAHHEATADEIAAWQTLAAADREALFSLRKAAGRARAVGADNGMLHDLIGAQRS